ncbi:kelch-like ECH-associated protein 1B isoform X1 [Dermacentor andersoni]|uniref:kelch-like ECH-associated protein 1B isoform X1 n=1 Tax=Dermacentor andersoni TaxID=34620 RepID=UPI0024166E9F|nr:kelch-like ECH-associated protein 1B isoform X1 [Dermacentor andersoni]
MDGQQQQESSGMRPECTAHGEGGRSRVCRPWSAARRRRGRCFRVGARRADGSGDSDEDDALRSSPPPLPPRSSGDREDQSEWASYPREALSSLESLWRDRKLCDVEIDASGEGVVQAHRVVLAAAIPYFRAMFTSNLRESQARRVSIKDVGLRAMELIVHFAYTGHIEVDEKSVCQLLLAANMLQVQRITNACCRFLERQLDPSNCIGIAEFCQQHHIRDLQDRAERFAEQHFSMVCRLDEFLSLPWSRLFELLRRDGLNVRSETEVYEALVRWVRHDERRRAGDLESALRKAVRCHRLAPSFLRRQLAQCALLRDRPGCADYVADVVRDLTLYRGCSCCDERCPSVPSLLYVAGGYLRRSLCTVDYFSAESGLWSALPPLPLERSGPGGAFLAGLLYVVGGRVLRPPPELGEDVPVVHCFDPARNCWSERCPMGVPRHRLGLAVLDGLLYAVAGSHGTNCLSSVERYDPSTNAWTSVAGLSLARYGLGAAVVRRRLYAVGGCDSATKFGLVERYCPERDRWDVVAPLKVPRSGAGTVAFGKHIYVIGGYDGQGQVSSVERYDTDHDIWEMVAPLNTRRSALSAAVLDGKIYALGGYDGQEYLSTVEVYDPATNVWTTGPPMPSCKSGQASCSSPAPCVLHKVL